LSEENKKNHCPFCKNLKHCQSIRIPVSESDRRTSLSLKAKYCVEHNIIFNTEKSNVKFWDGKQVVETVKNTTIL
jgi:hypothetical protein